VAEAESFFLADVGDVNHVGDGADDLEQIILAGSSSMRFEFVADIEVVFRWPLAAGRVMMRIWLQPEAMASSTPYWMMGLSTSGSISLAGLWLRAGSECRGRRRGNGFTDFHLLHKEVFCIEQSWGRRSLVLRRNASVAEQLITAGVCGWRYRMPGSPGYSWARSNCQFEGGWLRVCIPAVQSQRGPRYGGSEELRCAAVACFVLRIPAGMAQSSSTTRKRLVSFRSKTRGTKRRGIKTRRGDRWAGCFVICFIRIPKRFRF